MTSVPTGEWHLLAERLPEGDRAVQLFPCITDIGILFVVSNPDYARINALSDGYTHWAEIARLPDGVEEAAEAAQEALRQAEGDYRDTGYVHYWRGLQQTLAIRRGAARRRASKSKRPLACR